MAKHIEVRGGNGSGPSGGREMVGVDRMIGVEGLTVRIAHS